MSTKGVYICIFSVLEIYSPSGSCRTAHRTSCSCPCVMSSKSSIHFLTRFLRMTLRILLCCSISREMLRGRSSESTMPRIKLRYSGIRSSQLSMMNTRLTYTLMLFLFFLFSNRSKGARQGTNRRARNSSWPSTEKRYTVNKAQVKLLIILYAVRSI